MKTVIEDKLDSLGITLPEPPAPAGSYVPITAIGNMLFVSGQIPFEDGKIQFTGKVSEDNLGTGQRSARLCALNVLAQVKRNVGLDKIEKIVKVSGFVNSESNFTKHPSVINGASDLFFEIFGESGRHARVAIGVSGLPFDSMTEIDAIMQISDHAHTKKD